MRPIFISIISLFTLLAIPANMQGQADHETALNYVLQYKDIAIEEMHRTGIPASIKLGQGLLESSIGASRLATKANNHFGAKCHNTWFGDFLLHDDDAPQECFRKYDSAYDSYIDHSYVLAKERYKFLYSLSPYDYKAWARGLKSAGYATDPNYAPKLIKIIERYALFVYDRMEHYPNSEVVMVDNQAKMKFNFVSIERKEFTEELVAPPKEITKLQKRITKKIGKIKPQRIQKFNSVEFVIYDKPVWPVQASNAYGLTLSELLDFNNAELDHQFATNERIYLEPMRKKAPRKNRIHQISEEETMRDVALRYAVQLEKLYEYNDIPFGSQPQVGEIIYLRNINPVPPALVPSVNQTKRSFENAWTGGTQDVASLSNNFNDAHKRILKSNRLASQMDSLKIYFNQREEILQVQLDGLMDFDFAALSPVVLPAPTDAGTSEKNSPNEVASQRKVESGGKSGEKVYHLVVSGDTLSEIAQEYKVAVSKIKQLNTMKSTVIKIGQKLRIK